METRRSSLQRLNKKAVRIIIIFLSLLFYVVSMHFYYYQKTLSIIGSLKTSESIVQQQVLNSLFTKKYGIEDGIYVLMKNGYYHHGRLVLFVDPIIIVITLLYILIVFFILLIYKRYAYQKAVEIQNELNYVLEELEHFVYKGKINRKDQYEKCNYILDRLKNRLQDTQSYNQEMFSTMIKTHQDIIHQIKTPLNVIKIWAEQFELQGKITRSEFDTINYAIEKATGLANTYMRASKFDAGKVQFENEKINLYELIEDIFKLLKVQAEYFQTKLINNCDNVTIFGDIVWLSEAISNIIKNAIENAGMCKKVFVSSKLVENKIQIIVEDNGNANELVDHISFERFESSKTGIGIGLHLCKEIIERHLGEISVEQSILGGLKFSIVLPKYEQKKKVELENYYEDDC